MSWLESMIKRYGSEEAVREEMKRRQELSRKNYNGSGGLRALSKERRKEISKMGVQARQKKPNSLET